MQRNTLYKSDTFINENIFYLFNKTIYEFDMKNAGYNLSRAYKLLPDDKLEELGYNLLPEPVIFSPHYLGIPQHRERVYIMCIRKDVGEVRPFTFTKAQIIPCTINSILQDDGEIPNIEEYRISPDMEELINIWNEFIRNIYLSTQ